MVDQNIFQLKGNVIPKGMVPLENFFDANDVPVNVNKKSWADDVEDCNVGTKKKPNL